MLSKMLEYFRFNSKNYIICFSQSINEKGHGECNGKWRFKWEYRFN